MTTFQPLNGNVLVRPIQPEDLTEGGIALPELVKEKPQDGIVIAVGDGRVLDFGARVVPVVASGDRVVFARYGGQEVKLDGETYLVLDESSILGIKRSSQYSAVNLKLR